METKPEKQISNQRYLDAVQLEKGALIENAWDLHTEPKKEQKRINN